MTSWRSRHCRYVHLRVFLSLAPRAVSALLQARLLCHVSFPALRPVCFSCTASRWLLLGQRMVFAWATVMDSRFFEYVVLESLRVASIVMDSSLVFFFRRLLPSAGCSFLTFRCGQGFFPVARPVDPDIVPCIDGDDGASCAEVGWRVCLCSACLNGTQWCHSSVSISAGPCWRPRGRSLCLSVSCMARRTQSCARADLFLFCRLSSGSIACPSFQLVFGSVSLFPRTHTELFDVFFHFSVPCCCRHL